jgi:hypothetical protein
MSAAKDTNGNAQNKQNPPLKGFFRSGENYVTLLDCKSKVLSRLLEEEQHKENVKETNSDK